MEDFEQGRFGPFQYDESYDFKIAFFGRVARKRIHRFIWADDQQLEEFPQEEKTIMTFSSSQWIPIQQWLLSFGADAMPLEPDWLVENWRNEIKKMSAIINSAVFPGIQGGPLEHVIAAKAVAFGEALTPEYKEYQQQVVKNSKALAEALTKRGYKIVSGGTDNHLMLVDLRTKFPELTGKLAEKCLVAADITTNKNMVPFDSRTPFTTSGLRFGTPAITTRGVKEDKMDYIAELIDRVLSDPENEENIAAVRKDVNAMMNEYPLFAW